MSTKRISITEVILWIFAVFLILLSLTPFALGFKVKTDYSKLLSELSQILQIELQLQQYEQGYFSSEAIIAIKIPNVPEQIHFKEEIIHGPIYLGLLNQGKSPLIAAVVNGQLDVSPSQEEMVRKIFTGKNPLVYQNIINFTGDVESQAYIPAINTIFEDEYGPVSIQSAGMILNESYVSSTGQLKGEAQVPAFKVKSELFSMNALSLTMSFSGAMGASQLMIGDSVASMSLLDFDSGDEQFAVRDLTVRSVTSENGPLINSGAQLSAREILASNQKFGPVQFNLSFNGINASSLNKIQEIQKEVDAKLEQGLPPEQVDAMMTGQVMGLLPDLIKQAEIKVNPLTINSELGKLEADMEFMLEGIDENTPADPMFLLGAISLDLNMSIDEQLLKQFVSWQLTNQLNEVSEDSAEQPAKVDPMLDKKIDENIAGMVAMNWLVMDEGVYISKVSMHQGELLINENPVDPMQQLMSSMGAPGGMPDQ